VKIRGEWVYLYRAVDRAGKTVDFRLSPRRDVAAAKVFFRKAIKSQGSAPRSITLDGYAASHRAVREMKADGQLPKDIMIRSSKYLNNLVEQDPRGVKHRIGPMLGFKWFRTAAITIAGIELLRRIHKGPIQPRQVATQSWKYVRRLERGVGSVITLVLLETCDGPGVNCTRTCCMVSSAV
jgi:transposase-like protein